MTVPDQDLTQRWRQLRELGTVRNLDLMLVYFDEYNMADGFYFSGIWTQFERGLVAVSTHSGRAALLTGPETARYAAVHVPSLPTHILSVFMAAGAEYPNTRAQDLPDVLADLSGRASFRIGLVGTASMPVPLHQALSYVAEELVDVSPEIERLRQIKSANEIAAVRQAFHISEQGLQAALRSIEAGVTETAVAGAAESAMRAAGAEGYGYSTILATNERSNAVFSRPTNRPIRTGDVVMVGLSPRFQGYCASLGIPVPVGPIEAETHEYIANLLLVYREIERALAPGIRAQDLYELSRQALLRVGLDSYQLYGAMHSMGLYEAEPPFLSPSAPWHLQPGMVLAIDLAIFHPRLYGIRFESGYLITDVGAENLANSFQSICDHLVERAI